MAAPPAGAVPAVRGEPGGRERSVWLYLSLHDLLPHSSTLGFAAFDASLPMCHPASVAALQKPCRNLQVWHSLTRAVLDFQQAVRRTCARPAAPRSTTETSPARLRLLRCWRSPSTSGARRSSLPSPEAWARGQSFSEGGLLRCWRDRFTSEARRSSPPLPEAQHYRAQRGALPLPEDQPDGAQRGAPPSPERLTPHENVHNAIHLERFFFQSC